MADRTYYYDLDFEQSWLKDMSEKSQSQYGMIAADLTEAEKDAVDTIRRLLTSVIGPAEAEVLHEEWVDETETYPDHVPRAIRRLANLLGSAYAWQKMEAYDRRVETDDDGEPLLMSQNLLRMAKTLWDEIVAAGYLPYDDGTDAIDFTAISGALGYGIGASTALFFPDFADEKSFDLYPEFSSEQVFKDLDQ